MNLIIIYYLTIGLFLLGIKVMLKSKNVQREDNYNRLIEKIKEENKNEET